MNRRRFSIFRVISIVFMLLAWSVASNRCAFASLNADTPKAKTAAIHSCCAGSAAESKPHESGECCKKLGVLPVEAAQLAKAADVSPLPDLAWLCLAVLDKKVSVAGAVQDSGPPEFGCFAEVVLQGSLRSLAPPFVV